MRERPRGLSVRVKLTLSYAAFVLIVAVAVFALGFLSLRFVPDGNLVSESGGFAPRRVDLQEVYIRYSWWTLLALVVIGLVGGWFVAGWMLRPLTRVTDVARRVRDGSLAQRVTLPGPRDEVTDLADTFDDMLDRVTRTIEAERRFAANASHELRTPHAVMRTLLEVARADPDGRDVETLLARLDETNERAIRLTDALLRLSRAAHGDTLPREPIAFGDVVGSVVASLRPTADAARIAVRTTISPVTIPGDAVLLEQLVENLVRNAIVHNVADGVVDVELSTRADGAVLVIQNSGPVVDAAIVDSLVEPFVRARSRMRTGSADGQGLGLAIVDAIVDVHGGRLSLSARAEGGLRVEVALPA